MAFQIDNSNDGFDAPDDFQMSTRIMVFGVGGAGGNAVAHMVDSEVTDVDYVIANTDVNALRQKNPEKMKRIQLGRKTTGGRGAGNDPSKGKASAEESRDDIVESLNGVSMLFVTAGMGGGTGTGAAPVVANLAKEKGILTVGVVTKPFKHEGQSKMDQAIAGISEMKKYVDALIVVPNERLKQLKGTKITLKNAFIEVDNVLRKAVIGIISLLQTSGQINVDFADIGMALKDSGVAHMAIGTGKGANKLDDALDEVLNSPLLETSINGARRGLINVSVPDSFSLDEYDQVMDEISEKFNNDARFKCGLVFDSTLADDEISLIVVATDFVDEQYPDEFDESISDPMPSVTISSTSDGTGNIVLSNEANDMDALLRKLNHGRDF